MTLIRGECINQSAQARAVAEIVAMRTRPGALLLDIENPIEIYRARRSRITGGKP